MNNTRRRLLKATAVTSFMRVITEVPRLDGNSLSQLSN